MLMSITFALSLSAHGVVNTCGERRGYELNTDFAAYIRSDTPVSADVDAVTAARNEHTMVTMPACDAAAGRRRRRQLATTSKNDLVTNSVALLYLLKNRPGDIFQQEPLTEIHEAELALVNFRGRCLGVGCER